VATYDIPNAFIQTEVNLQDQHGNKMIMVIRGALVNILCYIDVSYRDYIVRDNGRKMLYVHIIKEIYRLLESALQFYNKLANALTTPGFEINPYDPCVVYKVVDGKHITVTWHVDNVKVSHMLEQVVTSFVEWLDEKYGDIGKVKVTRGNFHEYLGMTLDYLIPGQVSIDMSKYVQQMLNNFPQNAFSYFFTRFLQSFL
ncbi:hypothetical protein TI04_09085, partial [Achromatium sp. WMS2]